MKRKTWTKADIELLRRDYPDTPSKILADRFDCTVRAVYGKARALGVCKTQAYMNSPHAYKFRQGDNTGNAFKFKPGHRPHNKGKKGWQAGGNAHKTQFKPGYRSHTWQPIGTERICKDGYLQRKVTDTRHSPRDWVGVHIILWKEHRGEIPKNHMVVFRNGDKKDLQIDNLELITRAENMQRNSIHRYPPALKETIKLAGKLRRTIHEKQN
ncbi:HNH endonuclease [bacterium endosymbiont of Escarpia laminata]|nr:MAG: HNH endonuclease [bacterium endosymbiont of Escarpia laminata]